MSPKAAAQPLATLLGDVVGSRAARDRQGVHDRLTAALEQVGSEVEMVHPLQVVAGDEFQGTFVSVGEALYAAVLLRLRLDPDVDVRIGVGWGGVEVLDAEHGTQDGPGWWAARAAIEWVEEKQQAAGWQHVRTAYRPADATGGPSGAAGADSEVSPEAVNAALHCQDHLLGLMDARSRHILEGLMHGRTQTSIADELGLTRQAINQRRKHDGLAVVAASVESLRAMQ